jgi:uncharacterized membrane protein
MKTSNSRLALRKQGKRIKDLDGKDAMHPYEVAVEQNHHEGPIPSPKALAEYENVLPGLADRIMMMAESNASHIRKKEANHLNKYFFDKNIGRIIGSIIILTVLWLTKYAIDANMPILAGILGGTTVIGLATIFILGKKSSKETAYQDENESS